VSDLLKIAKLAASLPKELQVAQRRGIQQGALAVTKAIRAEVKSASGGDNRLSGVGKKGARVGAKYDVKGQVNPTALIKATGPMQLLEHPTRPHEITPRKRRKKGALRFKDGTFAMNASHPGTRPKKPFERGVNKTQHEPARLLDKAVQDAIRKAIR
jgi:hypothetical protein